MSQLTLQLPNSLSAKLSRLAAEDGVSLETFALYTLVERAATRWQVTVVPPDEVADQEKQFKETIARWGVATDEEFDAFFKENESAPDDPEFTPELRAAMIELLER